MSLMIDIDRVASVMVGGQWFTVLNESFDIDAYEYVRYPPDPKDEGDHLLLHGGGARGICSAGFRFMTDTVPPALSRDRTGMMFTPAEMSGPLDAIQAVAYKPS